MHKKHRLLVEDDLKDLAQNDPFRPIRRLGRPLKRSNKPTREPDQYRKFKGSVCERCGFVPVHRAQLDVHHKDRNFTHNEEENLITLCANCHRLIEALGKIDKRWLLGVTPTL